MKKSISIFLLFSSFITLGVSCRDNEPPQANNPDVTPDTVINFVSPEFFPVFEQPANNPLTKRGLELGRMLFYDPILSSDSSISCASCHNPTYSFSDNRRFSEGVGGALGNIQAMPLINLAWQRKFFWNGRANSLEQQALGPINNPIEMHETSANVVKKLKAHAEYPKRFRSAFGTDDITPEHIGRAIAQFERTMISNGSKFDEYPVKQTAIFTDALEIEGFQIFFTERGQCFHCHGAEGTFLAHNLDTLFRNNGLLTNAEMLGKGLYEVTGKKQDEGMFKVPTLRNVQLTAPYMHDGRFNTLEQVIEFYSSGIKQNDNLDVNFSKNPERLEEFGGLGFTPREKQALVKFLETFTDTIFTRNPAFQNPFKK